MAAGDPWARCAECDGAGVTPCGRYTSEKSAPDFPCDCCGGTGLARIRDPEGHGAIVVPPVGDPPTATHRRIAEGVLDRILPEPVGYGARSPAQQTNLLAQFLADYEAFLRSAPA